MKCCYQNEGWSFVCLNFKTGGFFRKWFYWYFEIPSSLCWSSTFSISATGLKRTKLSRVWCPMRWELLFLLSKSFYSWTFWYDKDLQRTYLFIYHSKLDGMGTKSIKWSRPSYEYWNIHCPYVVWKELGNRCRGLSGIYFIGLRHYNNVRVQ